MQTVLRTYFRPDPRCSIKAQNEAVKSWPGKIIRYDEEKADQTAQREGWIRAMRAGELFGVPFFHRLATSAAELRAVRAKIAPKKATILELATGRRSDDCYALADMVQEALDFYARRGLSSAEAAIYGKLGADASPVTKARTDRMPNELAEEILNNHEKYPTLKVALRAINNATNAKGKKFKRKWNEAHIYQQVKKGKLNLKPRRAGRRVKR